MLEAGAELRPEPLSVVRQAGGAGYWFQHTRRAPWGAAVQRGGSRHPPRAVIRQAFAAEYLEEENCETPLDALDKKNLLSHTYRKELALEAEALIKTCYHPALATLHATLQAQRQP